MKSVSEVEANARLIAAAPDMLEALEEVLNRLNSSRQNWIQNAVDAQKRGDNELSISIQNMALQALSGFPEDQIRAAIAKAKGE